MGENQADLVWKVDKTFLPPGQCIGSQVHSGHGCYPEMWIQLVKDPHFSPDLAPSDYYLFPKIKKELGGHHCAIDDDVDHFLMVQNGVFYTEGIRLLHNRWTK